MKTTSLFLAGLLVAGFATAQTWSLDKAHSNLSFTVSHLVVQDVDGAFKDFSLTLNAAKDDFSDAQITLTANVAGIDTQSEKRDEHLKGPDFFDADKFPTFSFKGASFKKVSGNHYELKGALTLHGVTKPLVLKVDLKGKGEDPFAKKAMAGFKVYGKVKRTDFNIGSSTPAAIVGDEVEIKANIAVVKS